MFLTDVNTPKEKTGYDVINILVTLRITEQPITMKPRGRKWSFDWSSTLVNTRTNWVHFGDHVELSEIIKWLHLLISGVATLAFIYSYLMFLAFGVPEPESDLEIINLITTTDSNSRSNYNEYAHHTFEVMDESNITSVDGLL